MPRHKFNYPPDEVTDDGWVNPEFFKHHIPEVAVDDAFYMAAHFSLYIGTWALHLRGRPKKRWRKVTTMPGQERVMQLKNSGISIGEAEKILRKEGYLGRSKPRFY